jgi:hypothetical protein
MPVFLATWEAKVERIRVGGQTRQKVHEIPSQPIKSWAWWCTPVIPALWEV